MAEIPVKEDTEIIEFGQCCPICGRIYGCGDLDKEINIEDNRSCCRDCYLACLTTDFKGLKERLKSIYQMKGR
jgi:hypothetical protein